MMLQEILDHGFGLEITPADEDGIIIVSTSINLAEVEGQAASLNTLLLELNLMIIQKKKDIGDGR